MRRLVVVLALAACGGGGGDPGPSMPPVETQPQPVAGTIDQYFTILRPTYRAHHVAVEYKTRVAYSTYDIAGGHAFWGSSMSDPNAAVESWRIADCGAFGKWAYVDGYGTASSPFSKADSPYPHADYPVQVVKQMVRYDGGPWLDLTRACNPDDGMPHGGIYVPYDLPATGEFEIAQWFRIWSGLQSPNQYGYWWSHFKFGEFVVNPCWLGEAPSSRQTVRQQEVWWDNIGGYVRGSLDEPAWVNGAPIDHVPVAHSTWDIYAGRDVGTLWWATDLSTSPPTNVCLQLVTTF